MRKKDYELIAKALQTFMMGQWRHDDPEYKQLCFLMADSLRANPKFDRQKFLTACGIEQPCDKCGFGHGVDTHNPLAHA